MEAVLQIDFQDRYFNPDTGRFLSEDPIGFDGGDANLYRYVNNNSINLTDPSGTFFPAAFAFLAPIFSSKLVIGIIGFEVGFGIGATYNKVVEDIDYSESYCSGVDTLSIVNRILPGTMFLNPDILKLGYDLNKRTNRV